jgi:hypothetical protein
MGHPKLRSGNIHFVRGTKPFPAAPCHEPQLFKPPKLTVMPICHKINLPQEYKYLLVATPANQSAFIYL